MRLTVFRRKKETDKFSNAERRYVSSLQKDILYYEGWTEGEVSSDYGASKKVHTIVALGYLEYEQDALVLTDKGRKITRNCVGTL